MNRITPDIVNFFDFPKNTIVLVGTNESGIHGAGFAKYCRMLGGLQLKQSFGFSGNCFGIPTKDWFIQSLPIEMIRFYVNRFIEFARYDIKTTYWVTKIGCGLAGYTPEQIAPLFKDCINLENVWLPQEFWNNLTKTNE